MTDKVSVTQADREAAADIWRDLIAEHGECMAEKAIRAGGVMDATPLVQAFARHRTGAGGEGTHWLDNLMTYHESGGHEGDGSDHALRQARKALSTLHSPSEAEVEAQRDFIDYHRSQLLNYLLPTANKLKNWSTINYHIQKLHEGGATAIAALSLPSDKTVELLREARQFVAIRGATTEAEQKNLLAEIDAHLGEQS